jgi:hypothetical protein
VHDERVLHLGGIDVHSTGDDEVGPPVGEVEITLRVHPAQVTDGRPAAVVVRSGGLARVVVVLEGATALEVDRTDLARRQFLAVVADDVHRTGDGPADRAAMGQPLR